MKQKFSSSTLRILAIAAVVVVGVGGFFAGVAYQKGKQPSTAATGATLSQRDSFGGQFSGQRPTRGQVTAVSGSSVTLTNERTGSTEQFAITSSTTITNNGQAASASDITAGETVMVIADSSSSSNAAQIIINPTFGSMQGGAGGEMSAPAQTN